MSGAIRIPFEGVPPDVKAGEPVEVFTHDGRWEARVALGPARYDEARAGFTVRLTIPVAAVADWMADRDGCRVVNWPAENVRPIEGDQPMTGPYNTEAETLAEPMPKAVRALHDADRVRPGDPDRLVRDTVEAALLQACRDAGVELGVFDRATIRWLAGWEASTVQVLIGIIGRAHEAG